MLSIHSGCHPGCVFAEVDTNSRRMLRFACTANDPIVEAIAFWQINQAPQAWTMSFEVTPRSSASSTVMQVKHGCLKLQPRCQEQLDLDAIFAVEHYWIIRVLFFWSVLTPG